MWSNFRKSKMLKAYTIRSQFQSNKKFGSILLQTLLQCVKRNTFVVLQRCFLSNLAHCPVSIPYGNVFRGYKNWILGWNGSNFSETFLEKNCILSFRKISEERQCFYQIHINMNAYNLKLYWKINSIIELKTNSIAHWDYNPQPISLLTNTQPLSQTGQFG